LQEVFSTLYRYIANNPVASHFATLTQVPFVTTPVVS